jgi:hypothetical protein
MSFFGPRPDTPQLEDKKDKEYKKQIKLHGID